MAEYMKAAIDEGKTKQKDTKDANEAKKENEEEE